MIDRADGLLDKSKRSKNPQAFDLYLHSFWMPHDPGADNMAISSLQRAVKLDPTYAPAWEQLGVRFYDEAEYSDNREQLRQSNQASERALQIDPNRVVAAGQLITNRVATEFDPLKAYQDAQALVKHHPESAYAHFVMGYVYRYTGMLEQSKRECDKALELDRSDYTFRSCAPTFMELGDTQRAEDFIRLGVRSLWSVYITPSQLLREGKIQEARVAVKRMASMPSVPRYHRDLLEACLQLRPPRGTGPNGAGSGDQPALRARPEMRYYHGALFAYCGKREAALHLLQIAVEQNHCAYTALQSDPLLVKLQGTSGFSELLSAAKECQDKFLARTGEKFFRTTTVYAH